jgi:hypothetical protein
MKIDYNKPIINSLFSMVITFTITILLLAIKKPVCIMYISKNGKSKKNNYLLFSYSLIFSIVVGISVLLFKTGNKPSNNSKLSFTINPKSFNPVKYSIN